MWKTSLIFVKISQQILIKQKLVAVLSYHSPCTLFKQTLEARLNISKNTQNGN